MSEAKGTERLDRYPSLNKEQKAAVRASLDPQLVVAGPGTGKTRVLTCRAAYLIEEVEMKPSEVVLVTFTRRAAGELVDRLSQMVGPEAQDVRAGTLHHFCYTLLRERMPEEPIERSPVAGGAGSGKVPEDFVVVDDTITDAFWQGWFQDHEEWCRNNDLNSFRQVKTHVSRVKMGIDSVQGRLQEGIQEYQSELERRGAVDFDDLLILARDLIEHNETVRAGVAGDLSAMLIDEFQDTDPIQYRILQRLGGEGLHLFCVADGDQSVYRFRGARPENIERFVDDFGCTKGSGQRHVLRTNYRTSRPIYEVAEGVLDRSDRLKDRGQIKPRDRGNGNVQIAPCKTRETEREFVRKQVQRWIEDGTEHSEIGVLTRWNARLEQLEREFLEAGIPCEASHNEELMETPPAKKLQALFRVVDAQRRGRPIRTPMGQLLEQMLPEDIVASLRDFARRALGGASDAAASKRGLWTAFQTVISSKEALKNARLEGERRRLNRIYATVTNLLQKSTDAEITIGEFGREVLRELEDPLRMLKESAETLTDPGEVAPIRKAGRILHEWHQDVRADEKGPRKLLVHHEQPQITRLWRQLLRRGLGMETDPPQPLPSMQEALFVQSVKDGVPPLGAEDVVITSDFETLADWGARSDAFDASKSPTVIVFSEGPATDTGHALRGGIHPDQVCVVGPSKRLTSPTVRLFKTLQAATGPPCASPLFPEYVMVDLEATSADPSSCRVAEIGALRVEHGEVVEEFSELVELPNDLTPEEASTLRDVCGLDPNRDFEEASPEKEVWRRFCAFVGEAPVVAHNGQQYDFRVLRRLAKKHEAEARWKTTYDLLPAAHDLFPDRERYDAKHLRKDLLGDDTATEHRALADCKDQERILRALRQKRARDRRVYLHEELTPLVVAALTYEDPPPETLSADGAALLHVGHTWALRGTSPAHRDLKEALPRALPDRFRRMPLYQRIDEERILETSTGLQPGLARRLDSLLEPYGDERLQSEKLEVFLNHLTLWGEEEPGDGQVVSLTTYHSAKGLEFERVICMDVHNNAFPPYFARDPDERRESRRLLYVGMTRAAQELVLTYPEHERGYDRRASPFLSGVPRSRIERLRNLEEGRETGTAE